MKMTSCENAQQSSTAAARKQRPFTIAVEGNIGAGKSTFLEHYAKVKQVEIVPEPVYKWQQMGGQNLLELQYQDPGRWSHLVQSYIQLTMAQNHVQPLTAPGKEIKMLERSIQSSRHCFIQNFHDTGKMSEAGFRVLVEWFDFLSQEGNGMDIGVDMFIYLRTSPKVAYQRLQKRARKEEEVVPLAYLEQVHDLHERWIDSIKSEGRVPVLVVDADQDVKETPDIYSRHEDKILGNSNNAKTKIRHTSSSSSSSSSSPRKPLSSLSNNLTNRVVGSA